jgi:hypothetical protein
MKYFRKLCLVGLVWATAVATVLAGIPRTACRCQPPSSPASSPTAPAMASCCCGTSCSDVEAQRPEKRQGTTDKVGGAHKACCSQRTAKQPDMKQNAPPGACELSVGGPQLHSATCHKELLTLQVPSIAGVAGNAGAEVHLVCGLATFASTDYSNISATNRLAWLAFNRPPPPSDLLSTLQRLTI